MSQLRDESFLSSPLFARALAENEGRAAKAHLAAGRPIYCGDERYPGMVIKKFPDGRKQLIRISGSGEETVIREM
jgi:hypothetical protein